MQIRLEQGESGSHKEHIDPMLVRATATNKGIATLAEYSFAIFGELGQGLAGRKGRKPTHQDDATAGVYGSNRALHAAIKNQVIDFGDVLLRLSAKRVSALEAFAAATGNHGPSEEARNRHYAACPQVILPLSRVGPRARAAALRLGEEHRAFDALVELLMNPSGSDGVSPSTAAQQKQLAFYVNQFGRDFAFTLYDYFLSKGISSRLLSQPDAHDALVAEFMELRREECESISWLHDVKLGKFASVDQQVTELARTEGEALSKGDLLSFGKLSLLADKPASVLAAASAAAGASPELDEEDLACGSAIRQYDGGIRALDMQSQMVSWAEQRLEERYGGDANDALEKLAALSHDAIVLRAAAVSCDPTLLQRHVHPDAALPELQSTNAANSTVPADYSINGVGALVGVSGWTGLAAWYACLFATAAEGITLTIDDLTDLVTLAALDGDSTLATPAQRGLRFARLLRIIFENSADPAMPVPVIEYAVRTVWRRMFLHDDWASLAPLTSRLSAQDLNDAVEHTTLYHFVHECHKLGLGGHRNMFSDPYSCAHGLAEDDVHARIARHRSACDDEMKANVEVHGWANDIFAGLEEESAQIEQLCDKARLVDFYNLVGDLLRPKLVADVNATAANIADAMDEDM
ncbi:hypothetical protein GQ42DRAFT_152352 [Ramicandelaber brevisporus]|nr:hypothetical protein GQ42DRAFT_152352 [Ramicandelaber brevisporus]